MSCPHMRGFRIEHVRMPLLVIEHKPSNAQAVDALKERLAPDVTFQGPIIKYSGRDAYLWNIRALRAGFDVSYTLHRAEAREPAEIVTR